LVVKARTGLKQWNELEQEALAERKASPGSSQALYSAAFAMLAAGKLERAGGYIAELRNQPILSREQSVLIAWHTLLSGKTDAKLSDTLQNASPSESDPTPRYLAGFLQLIGGRIEDARASLSAGLEMDAWTRLNSLPWVLQGWIQDSIGNPEAAAAAYAKARQANNQDASSAWVLSLIPATPTAVRP
jgi:hypothetical protein